MKKQDYRNKISFLTTPELISEYESVKDLCQYVGDDSFEHQKRKIIEQSLSDRNLSAIIDNSFSIIGGRSYTPRYAKS